MIRLVQFNGIASNGPVWVNPEQVGRVMAYTGVYSPDSGTLIELANGQAALVSGTPELAVARLRGDIWCGARIEGADLHCQAQAADDSPTGLCWDHEFARRRDAETVVPA